MRTSLSNERTADEGVGRAIFTQSFEISFPHLLFSLSPFCLPLFSAPESPMSSDWYAEIPSAVPQEDQPNP